MVDFEGEPARSLPERRAKHSPLRDVAGMLRSFSYLAAVTGRSERPDRGTGPRSFPRRLPCRRATPRSSRRRRSSNGCIQVFELEKVVYELRYELDHRPDWVHIPVSALERMLDHEGA